VFAKRGLCFCRLAQIRTTCSHSIIVCCVAPSRAPIIVPSPPIYAPMYPSTGIMVAPGAAVVSTGPGIVDIAIVSMFLVMAASAATSALKGSDVDGDDFDAGKAVLLAPRMSDLVPCCLCVCGMEDGRTFQMWQLLVEVCGFACEMSSFSLEWLALQVWLVMAYKQVMYVAQSCSHSLAPGYCGVCRFQAAYPDSCAGWAGQPGT
jgi:hypothetical protein